MKTRAGMKNQFRILCGVAISPTVFRRKKGVSIKKLNGGPSEGYKPKKGDSQQRQHSYQKGVLDIAYLCCSNSHG